MRKFDRNLSFSGALTNTYRQKFDPEYGGRRSKQSALADAVTQSAANFLGAPENNRPGRVIGQRGWGNNQAGMATQELTNSLFWTGKAGKQRRGR
jgi:hypothetical protein